MATAPCTQPPAELAAIPATEQWRDIVRVAALANVPPTAWPSPSTEIPAVVRTLWRPWMALPASAAFRVSDLLRSVGWTGTPNYLLVTGDRPHAQPIAAGPNRSSSPSGRLELARSAGHVPQVNGALLSPRRVAVARSATG